MQHGTTWHESARVVLDSAAGLNDNKFNATMEVKQFYNKTISPLVTRTFPCKWSEDDRLSVVTERVLHIFEIKPAPCQAIPILNVSRSFVNSPKTVPGELYAEKVLSKIFEWQREEVFSFLMNDVHTPNFPKAKALKPEIVNVFWSPKGLLHPQKCLLAVLTSAGALEILVQIEKSWISMHELNRHWFQVIGEDFESLKDTGKVSAECLREQLNRLLITDVTWSNLCQGASDTCFAYLVTAHRNSEIAVWKVCRLATADTIHMDTCMQVEFKFRKKLTEDSIKINNMLWVHLEDDKYLLLVGFYNGQIGILKLQEFEGGLTSSSYNICYRHDDGIAIDSMQVLRQATRQLELLVIKGMYLLVITIDIFGKMQDMKFVTSPGFTITGASIINENSILTTTQDGKICMVRKSHSQILNCVPIRSDIAKEALQYLGFASSRNKLLYVLVSSPSVMYDHLSNREPTNLCFFTLHKLESENLLESLYNNEEQSLTNNWDYLDLMKVNALKRGLVPKVKTDSLDLMSLYELKVSYWLLEIMETARRKNFTDEQQQPAARAAKEIEQVKSCIFLYSASSYLRRLVKRENLSDTQKLSMRLVRSHLEVWHAGEVEEEAKTPLSSSVDQILVATKGCSLIHRESCSFCKDAITEPWKPACSQGHKLPRCALSRLQVTCTKYRSCPICKEIYHPCLDDLAKEINCIYCDVPAVYAHSQVDPELLASGRNLTKDKLIFIGSNNNKDKEKDEEDET